MKREFKKIIEESGVLEGLKTQEDVSNLLKDLHSDLLKTMLRGELESHLGYAKNEKSESVNARNGTTSKKLKSEFGESTIEVPRDRQGSFEPVIVPKHQSMATPVENIIISLYAKGMSASDIDRSFRKSTVTGSPLRPYPSLRTR